MGGGCGEKFWVHDPNASSLGRLTCPRADRFSGIRRYTLQHVPLPLRALETQLLEQQHEPLGYTCQHLKLQQDQCRSRVRFWDGSFRCFQLRRQLEAAEAQGAADRALISELSAQRAEHAEPGPETVLCASDASCLGVGRGAFRRRR